MALKKINSERNKKIVLKQDLKHEDYKNILFNNEQMFHKMKAISSDHHHLGSYELNKVSLSCFDHKNLSRKKTHSYVNSGYKYRTSGVIFKGLPYCDSHSRHAISSLPVMNNSTCVYFCLLAV